MKDVKKNRSVDESVGSKIEIFRKIYDIQRKELAEKFHISYDAVYRIERGETGLSSEYAYILANEYGCDINFIYGSEDIFEFILKSIKDNVNKVAGENRSSNIMKEVSLMLRLAAEIMEQYHER